jgi:hypothetical protein
MNGQEGQTMPEAKEHAGMRRFKNLFKFSLIVIVILLVVLIVNALRMRSLEGGYATGYNDCAASCNQKLDFLKANCIQIATQPEQNMTPGAVIGPIGNVSDNTSIQIVTE